MKTIGYSEALSLFSSPNKIYKIYNNINLGGSTLTVPSGCTLDFQGGSFINGTLNINGAKILPSYEYLAKGSTPITVSGNPATGTCKFADSKPSWWGGSAWVDVDPNAVLKTPQALTSAEKSQVKQNIGLDTDLSGLQTQISDEVTRATAAENTLSSSKANKATTLSGYGITDAYTKTEVNGLVSTPHQNYVTVSATSGTTAASQVLPTSGQSTDTIYRVSNWDGSTNSFNVTKYSEYAWNEVNTYSSVWSHRLTRYLTLRYITVTQPIQTLQMLSVVVVQTFHRP